ncbi:uncharacterized protein IL334_003371 [Kwoniella shivajii]|uniref:Myb-like domain-containing protein n=1 Tax=Kwoniella shivajii TaxID=564305 RepID=A0ABZ1CXD3_9TREE|nr:hypothetical protein IL334_003371 [Kwoniella shivajii]
MPAVKRESSSTPSSEFIKSSPPSTPSPKKSKPSPKKGSADKPRKAYETWTAEEDRIFIEIMDKVLKNHLYPEVKADGRLTRESPAVRAHLTSMMNKLKKSP